jgi:SHS2 domain-containing protein
MYEVIEHTADIGLRLRAATLDLLFAEAGRALMGLLFQEGGEVFPVLNHTVQLESADRNTLLVDWLNELLYLASARHLVFVQFDVRLTDNRLVAQIRGETADPARHTPDHEIKAITYHKLKVEQEGQGWMAEVILDI